MKVKNKNEIKHVSIIMDGNGRWAKEKKLPRTAGHNEGVKKAKEIVSLAKELSIPYLSLYTFSKENWKRPQTEVKFLMNLIISYLEKEFEYFKKNKIRIRHLGDKNGLPKDVVKAITKVEKETKDFTNTNVLLAINYSGKYDIIQAVNKIVSDNKNKITEDDLNNNLLTSGIPNPELIIRTSGEFRISNYFLWQAAYSEFYICDKYWPDFQKEDFMNALDSYCNRERRFGGINKEKNLLTVK